MPRAVRRNVTHIVPGVPMGLPGWRGQHHSAVVRACGPWNSPSHTEQRPPGAADSDTGSPEASGGGAAPLAGAGRGRGGPQVHSSSLHLLSQVEAAWRCILERGRGTLEGPRGWLPCAISCGEGTKWPHLEGWTRGPRLRSLRRGGMPSEQPPTAPTCRPRALRLPPGLGELPFGFQGVPRPPLCCESVLHTQ